MNRPQFGLKTIFLATFVVAVMSLATTRQIYLQRQVDHAFAIANRFAARGLATDFAALPWPKATIDVDFSGSQSLDDEALKTLADLPIEQMNLTGTHVSDKAVEAFRRARPSAVVKR